MENKKRNNNGLLALVIVLVLLVLTLSGYIVYDKVLSSNSIKNNRAENNNSSSGNITNSNSNENDDIITIVNNTIKNLFGYVHSMGPYCGKRDYKDYIEEGYNSWSASSFANKNELDNYLNSFMTEAIRDKYALKCQTKECEDSLYREKNGKLYCSNSNKDCGSSYNESKTTYKIINATDNKINAVGNIAFDSCGGTDYYIAPIELNKNSDNNWLASSYIEIGTGVENIRTVNSYLLDNIIYYNKTNENHKISIVYGNTTATSEKEISALKDKIDAPYESPNGEKWIEIKIDYDNNGYISKIIL